MNYRNFYNKYASQRNNLKSIHDSDYHIIRFLIRKYDSTLLTVLNEVISDEMVVVDIGCGGGYFLNLISSYNVQLVGLEISDIEIDRARQNIAKDNISLIQHDLSFGLPFKNDSVDIIFNSSVLEHLENPEHMIREAYRVLKKSGKIIGRTPNKYSLMEIGSKILSESGLRRVLNKPDPGHISLFTEKYLSDCLTTSDFQIDYIDCSGLYIPGFRLFNFRIFTSLFKMIDRFSDYTKRINWVILYCATKK